jgi:FkbM family methyltransferase
VSALPARVVRAIARRGAGALGFDLVPRSEPVLERARRLGVRPRTVLDVGAAWGQWSEECHRIFRDARYILVEPLEELVPTLDAVRARLGAATVVTAAVAASDGEQVINVHRDLVGTSLFGEAEGAAVDGTPRTVPTVSLDALVERCDADGPYLLKLDVQGGELDALEGAASVLAQTHLAILEVTFFEFFRGGPLAHDVIARMRDHGFTIYDISELTYRPLDGALAQADFTFVPADGPLRIDHRFATAEQRAAQDAAFARTATRHFDR